MNVGSHSVGSPVNFFSLVYTHPELEKVDLNIHNPRLANDMLYNAKEHNQVVYKENTCEFLDCNCKTCYIPNKTKEAFCLRCKKGFKYFEGSCREEVFRYDNPAAR